VTPGVFSGAGVHLLGGNVQHARHILQWTGRGPARGGASTATHQLAPLAQEKGTAPSARVVMMPSARGRRHCCGGCGSGTAGWHSRCAAALIKDAQGRALNSSHQVASYQRSWLARRALIDQFIMAVLDKQRSVESASLLGEDIENLLNDTITLAVLRQNYHLSLNIPVVSAPLVAMRQLPPHCRPRIAPGCQGNRLVGGLRMC
jgi:hypothetical protein